MDCYQKDIHAAKYLVQRAKESNFNIICLGPLTNIALACCLDPGFAKKIDNIYIMGGTLSGKGNKDFNIEYNFATDPEAAYKVFKKFSSIHLVPWEASPEFLIPDEYYEKMLNQNCKKAKFLADTHQQRLNRLKRIMICDGFTPMIAIDPSICEEIHELEAKVYTQGDAAGQVSFAWPTYTHKYDKAKVNCKVYSKFKIEETMDLLLRSLYE